MRKLKGFTLVEILIVIVIIGILIGALVPRMQGAQGRARDVARKNDLSQIQAAIVASQQDKGVWPVLDEAKKGVNIGDDETLNNLLQRAGLSTIPADPLTTTTFKGLGESEMTHGHYGYMVAVRNGTTDGGFVLMAKTENEGGSNRVVCKDEGGIGEGIISNTDDIGKSLTLCARVDFNEDTCATNTANCTYTSEDQLRYVLTY